MQLGAADRYEISQNDYQSNVFQCAPGYVKSIVPYAYSPTGAVTGASYYCVKVADVSTAASSAPAVPTHITVSPNITTQVSPQVSPVFQQQFQPTNSPATAGTSQVAPTSQASPSQSGITTDEMLRIMRENQAIAEANRRLDDEARAREQAAMLTALNQAVSRQASLPSPAVSLPELPPLDQAAPLPALPSGVVIPTGSTLPANLAAPVPGLTTAPASDNKKLGLIAIAAGVLIGALTWKGSKRETRKR